MTTTKKELEMFVACEMYERVIEDMQEELNSLKTKNETLEEQLRDKEAKYNSLQDDYNTLKDEHSWCSSSC